MDSSCVENKTVVFLASPTDFRYKNMQWDRQFLESKGWKTKSAYCAILAQYVLQSQHSKIDKILPTLQWIEFEGGHNFAPESAYEEAAEWIEEKYNETAKGGG